MAVEAVHGFDRVAFRRFAEGVAHHDDVPPAHVHVPGQHDDPGAAGVDRVAQVGVAAAVAVPVVAEMAVGCHAARLVVADGVGFADGEIEAVRQPHGHRVGQRGRRGQSGVAGGKQRDGREGRRRQPAQWPAAEGGLERMGVPVLKAGERGGKGFLGAGTVFWDKKSASVHPEKWVALHDAKALACSRVPPFSLMDALTFLGTACGWPMSDRFHSSLLLEEGGRRWLLDAGEPCSHRLKAMGVPFGLARRRVHQPRAFGSPFGAAHADPGRVAGRPQPAAADLPARRADRPGATVAGHGVTCRKS